MPMGSASSEMQTLSTQAFPVRQSARRVQLSPGSPRVSTTSIIAPPSLSLLTVPGLTQRLSMQDRPSSQSRRDVHDSPAAPRTSSSSDLPLLSFLVHAGALATSTPIHVR